MAKHTYEPALDSCAITIHTKLELKYKLLVKAEYKEKVAKVIESICEEAVKDVPLTRKELDAIKADMKAAREKRMKNRIKTAAANHGLSEEAFIKRRSI